jgi:hypothetical protein
VVKLMFLMLVCVFSIVGYVFGEDEGVVENVGVEEVEETVKGVVEEIAPDNSYILVNKIKVFVTEEFLNDSLIEIGDLVLITVEKTKTGFEAKGCTYLFEEEWEVNDYIEEAP